MAKSELVGGSYQMFMKTVETVNTLSDSTQPGLWGEQLALLGIPYSTIPNTSENLVHMFPYKILRAHQLQEQNYANPVAFLNHMWTTCRPTPDSYIRSSFLMNVSLTSQDLQTLKTLVLWKQNTPEIFSNMNYMVKNILVYQVGNGVVGPCSFKMKQAQESIIIKSWTITSIHTLYSIYQILLLSSTMLLLTMHATSLPFLINCFRYHRSEDIAQWASHQDQPNCTCLPLSSKD